MVGGEAESQVFTREATRLHKECIIEFETEFFRNPSSIGCGRMFTKVNLGGWYLGGSSESRNAIQSRLGRPFHICFSFQCFPKGGK
jgi:hypothetical protein